MTAVWIACAVVGYLAVGLLSVRMLAARVYAWRFRREVLYWRKRGKAGPEGEESARKYAMRQADGFFSGLFFAWPVLLPVLVVILCFGSGVARTGSSAGRVAGRACRFLWRRGVLGPIDAATAWAVRPIRDDEARHALEKRS